VLDADARQLMKDGKDIRLSPKAFDLLRTLLIRRPVPVPPERHALILQPEDIGRTVLFVVTQPPRVLIEEIVMRPTTR